ncbi:hypothetical protein [Streptomyces sp. NPDC018045]|uniref:hypothetical protein n=1 Tax=Streptomyces sp. NPDC018045 TaxID=3365037 RepID=UPI0037A7A076
MLMSLLPGSVRVDEEEAARRTPLLARQLLRVHRVRVPAGVENPADRLYWRVLDALGFAPDAGKVGGPWRELGRDELTPGVLQSSLEGCLQVLFRHFG